MATEASVLICVVLAHDHQIVSMMPVVCSIGAHGHDLRDDLRFWAQCPCHIASLSRRARWYGSGRGPSNGHAWFGFDLSLVTEVERSLGASDLWSFESEPV
jgi:hypothetical protein